MGMPEFDLTDPQAALFCPACGAAYTEGRSRCADCDRELVPRAVIEATLAGAGPGAAVPVVDAETDGPEFDLEDPDAVAFCPSCGAGYGVGPVRCVDCGQELLPRSWVEEKARDHRAHSAAPVAPVPLADVPNPFKADVLASALKSEGISFLVDPGVYGAVRFLVLPQDLDRARLLLDDVDQIENTALKPDEEKN